MIVVVLDTNILASGLLLPHSLPGHIITKWQDGKFQVIVSKHIIHELKNTFTKPYFRKKIDADTVKVFLDLLDSDAIITPLSTPIPKAATHPADDVILATAESGKADYIVTGDYGLLHLKKFKKIAIISPRTLVEILQKQ